jgi:hypothetical protein
MIITRCERIRTGDVSKFAWSRLSQFQNIDHTASAICDLHKLDKKHLSNARQQAEQIKYCLSQAKEYFDAGKTVSLATRPVLLYYGVMSLALAEILLKQTGDSRLSVLRQKHNCHGLQLITPALPKPEEPLSSAANTLIAKAQTDATGNGKGTFEVWRRSAREYPVTGYSVTTYPTLSQSTNFEILLGAIDIPPPILGSLGITLMDCLRNLPYMGDVLLRLGSNLDMVRGKMTRQVDVQSKVVTVQTIIHPSPQNLLDRFGELVQCKPDCVNNIEIREVPSGYIFSQVVGPNLSLIGPWPHSICLTDEEIFFAANKLNLGEFGFLYTALHICGNFARYFPDVWLRHIERNSPLSMAINELCNHSFDRLPLLNLSELHRTYYVLED